MFISFTLIICNTFNYRSDILAEQKQRLKNDIEDLQARKRSLTEKAHELAEKYEDASEKKCLLIGR